MCKCACFKWFKKLFGLKKNCCCSSEAKDEVKVAESAPVEPMASPMNNEEISSSASQDVVADASEEDKEVFEQK